MKNIKGEKLIELGLEIVNLEMYEDTGREVSLLENEWEKLNNEK